MKNEKMPIESYCMDTHTTTTTTKKTCSTFSNSVLMLLLKQQIKSLSLTVCLLISFHIFFFCSFFLYFLCFSRLAQRQTQTVDWIYAFLLCESFFFFLSSFISFIQITSEHFKIHILLNCVLVDVSKTISIPHL